MVPLFRSGFLECFPFCQSSRLVRRNSWISAQMLWSRRNGSSSSWQSANSSRMETRSFRALPFQACLDAYVGCRRSNVPSCRPAKSPQFETGINAAVSVEAETMPPHRPQYIPALHSSRSRFSGTFNWLVTIHGNVFCLLRYAPGGLVEGTVDSRRSPLGRRLVFGLLRL